MQIRFHILHIEDEPAHAKLVEAVLRTYNPGYECENVNHLDAAIERLQQPNHKFKGVILDLGLPGGFRGIAAIQRLVESVEPIPIIIHTAGWDDDIEEAAFELGVQSFIYKGCDNQEFCRKVKRAFTRYYATRQWQDKWRPKEIAPPQPKTLKEKILDNKAKAAIVLALVGGLITAAVEWFKAKMGVK